MIPRIFTRKSTARLPFISIPDLKNYSLGGLQTKTTAVFGGAEMLSFVFVRPGFHYKTSNGLYFVHGKYYVETVGSSQSTKLLTAMVELAQKISGALAADDTKAFEARMALFPKDNIVPGSIRLYLTSAFGFEGLTDTFVADYQIDAETITAFLSRRSSKQDAKNVAQSYYKLLLDNGGVDKTAGFDDFSIGYARVVDFYGSIEIVFSNGEYVAGIHEAESITGAERVAAMLDARLNEVQKQ
jgi:hypothetical protein